MDMQTLYKAEKNTLTFIKNEAEIILSDLRNSEDILGNKSMTLAKVMMSIIVIIGTYCVNSVVNNNFGWMFYLACTLFLFSIIIVAMLYKNILPVDRTPSGTLPNLLLDSEMVDEDDEESLKTLLRSRVMSLQIVIDKAYAANKRKSKKLTLALKLLYTITPIILIFFLFLASAQLYQ